MTSQSSTKLNIREAIFVGHSVSGTELNKIAVAYPDRVKKPVYLDALDLGSGGWTTLPQPPPPPEETAADLESMQRFAAASARFDGYRKPLAAICNMIRTDRNIPDADYSELLIVTLGDKPQLFRLHYPDGEQAR